MLYSAVAIGTTVFRLRLCAQNAVEVERRLGKSVVDVLLPQSSEKSEGAAMPLVGDLVEIFHGALLKFHPEINIGGAYALYDEYIDDGGSYFGFLDILGEMLRVSGFFAQGTQRVPKEAQTGQEIPSA
jgi:hypothetical protein